MSKVVTRDIIVLLPGILGSVLQKDGRDVWNFSVAALWNAASTLGNSLVDLGLTQDDPVAEDLGDGVKATGLISGAHLVPGLWKIDGYSRLKTHLFASLDLINGGLLKPKVEISPANYFEFAYDWRRDIRASAHLLGTGISANLEEWRTHSGNPDAKVIFIAHSMGGLVARYYLEALEGWHECRALITFGTPFRGSLNALGYLANGYKGMLVDLSQTLRTFTSIYQLLPIYPAIVRDDPSKGVRIADCGDVLNVEQNRAADALEFHREIERGVKLHRTLSAYLDERYALLPLVGTRQRTAQSARLLDGHIALSGQVPPDIDPRLADGDGRVPYISAIPLELANDYREERIPERHAALQNHPQALAQIIEWIERMVPGRAIRGPELALHRTDQAAIELEVDDAYVAGDPVDLRAQVHLSPAKLAGLTFEIAVVQSQRLPTNFAKETAEGEVVATGAMSLVDGQWTAQVDNLDPGLYRVTVQASGDSGIGLPAVHDLFLVSPIEHS